MSRLERWLPDMPLLGRSAQTAGILFMRLLTQAAGLLFLVRALGPADYGMLAAATSLAVVLGTIPSFGAGYVLLSRLSTNKDVFQDVWSYSWPLTTLLGFLLTGPYIWACTALTSTTTIDLWLLIVLGIAELIFTPLTFILSVVTQARDRVPLSQVLQWTPFALKAGAAMLALAADAETRLTVYICLQSVAAALGTMLAWMVARKLAGLSMQARVPSRADLSSGSAYGLMHFVAANPSELDKVMSLRALGPADAGIYSASARILGAMVMPVTALLLSVQAKLFRHAATAPTASATLIRQVGGASALWGICSAGLLVVSAHWIPAIFGPGFQQTASFMPFLAFAAPLMALRISAGTVLVSHGHPLQRLAFEIAGALILCICMIVFTRSLGLNGAALALIVAEGTMAAAGWCMLLRDTRVAPVQGASGQ